MKSISFTVPMDKMVIRHTITMLQAILKNLQFTGDEENGPGEEDGPWAEGYETRSQTGVSLLAQPDPRYQEFVKNPYIPEVPTVPDAIPEVPTVPDAIPEVPTVPDAIPEVPTVPEVPEPPTLNPPLDDEKLPWDARIHVPTKTRRKSDNTWTLKRNISQLVVNQVKSELRALQVGAPIPEINPGDPDPVAIFGGTPATPATPDAFPAFLDKTTPRLTGPLGVAFKQALDAELAKYPGMTSVASLLGQLDLLPKIDEALEIAWNQLNSTQ